MVGGDFWRIVNFIVFPLFDEKDDDDEDECMDIEVFAMAFLATPLRLCLSCSIILLLFIAD